MTLRLIEETNMAWKSNNGECGIYKEKTNKSSVQLLALIKVIIDEGISILNDVYIGLEGD